MERNMGVFPEPNPEGGHKVLRKLIVQRRYMSDTGYPKITTGRFHEGELQFHERDGPHHGFLRYVLSEFFAVYVTALHYVYVPPEHIAQAANAAQEAANDAQVVANAGQAMNITHLDVNGVWRARQAHGQWGYAVFTGHTLVIYTTSWFGNGASNIPNSDWGPIAGVCQLYPCHSFRVPTIPGHQLDDQHLCVGLFYKHVTAANEWAGRRRYVRGPIPGLNHALADTEPYTLMADKYLHSLGNVWEILDNELIPNGVQLGLQYTQGATHRFAIYVCAGARLLVTDGYNYPDAGDRVHHNRTLIQQGGVVVVELPLYWAPPTSLVHPNGRFRALTTADAVAAGFLATGNQGLRNRLQGIDNPVVFLGPTESDLETHCWGLEICRNNGLFWAFLSPPERGIVTGIEDFEDGMDEIRARHRYEQLYGQVFTRDTFGFEDCCHDFEVPNDAMLRKILGMEPRCNEWLQINYHVQGIYVGNQAPANAPAPGAYRPIRCDEHFVTQVNRLHAPMRPLSPLFHLRHLNAYGQPEGKATYNWSPSHDSHERVWRRRGYDWYRLVAGPKWEKYSLSPNDYYQYERELRKSDYDFPIVLDGWNKRVAISGWIYNKKVGGQDVAKMYYPVYKRADHKDYYFN